MNNGKRWLYLFTGTLILLFLGLIYAWSIFKVPLSNEFGSWTESQLSMPFTISMMCFCLGGYFGGVTGKRLSVKIRLLIGAVCLLVGFLGVSGLDTTDSASSLIKLYIFYGVFCGGGVGLSYNAVVTTITKWFPDKIGVASGIMLMGFGFGGLVLGSAVNAMSTSMGIFSAFKVLAVAIAVVLVLGALVVKAPETQPEAGQVVIATTLDFTPLQMMKTARFWLFIFWCVCMSAAGLLVVNSAANISVSYGGSAILGMTISFFNGVGRIILGNSFDKVGRKWTTLLNMMFMLAGGIFLMLGGKSESLFFIVSGLVFVGLAFGGTPTLTSAYINKAFGQANFTTNYSIASFDLLPPAIIGPLVSAKLIEASGGKYDSSFIAIIVFTLIAFLIWILLNRSSRSSVSEGNR